MVACASFANLHVSGARRFWSQDVARAAVQARQQLLRWSCACLATALGGASGVGLIDHIFGGGAHGGRGRFARCHASYALAKLVHTLVVGPCDFDAASGSFLAQSWGYLQMFEQGPRASGRAAGAAAPPHR